jgi:hypothetical protein
MFTLESQYTFRGWKIIVQQRDSGFNLSLIKPENPTVVFLHRTHYPSAQEALKQGREIVLQEIAGKSLVLPIVECLQNGLLTEQECRSLLGSLSQIDANKPEAHRHWDVLS